VGPAGWLGHITVEFPDGRKAQTILIAVDGDRIDWEPIETALIAVTAGSEPLTNPVLSITTGHCGLNSPLDLDGSYWDPVGAIPADHPDRINSAEGTFALTSPDTATLRTVDGLVVQLVRHRGPKFILACD
jgi:hypothetical protein